MRIISDKSGEIEKRVICENCGTEIGYMPIDIIKKVYRDYGNCTEVVYYIECPRCKHKIYKKDE